jgi:16S rRNA A1518/A1519 N6-dimethyltransferase RsmA/KsgA/DIM1 with predicted DNA glycosylase/AP lyase activity
MPKMPTAPAAPAYGVEMPTVKEVMEANFAFASKLLKQQKDFADKLVAASSVS